MNDQSSSSPPHGSTPLSDAMKEFLPAEMWDEFARATEARKNPQRWPGASNNQEIRSRFVRLSNAWHAIIAAMKLKFETGELTAFGREDPPLGPWCVISAPAWRTLRITNVENGVASVGPNKIYDIYVLPPDATPESPDYDDLMRTGTAEHLRLYANIGTPDAEDLDLIGREGPPSDIREPPRPKRGKAGRPTDIAIILAELERRIEECSLELSLSQQAKALRDWFKLNHPKKRLMTAKTIENNAGELYTTGKLKCARNIKSAFPK